VRRVVYEGGASVNHSFDYQEKVGPEPLMEVHDTQRWDKWNQWYRKFCRFFPASNGTIDDKGFIRYHRRLKSQRTRIFNEVHFGILRSQRGKARYGNWVKP
jgi:hypothetical protein